LTGEIAAVKFNRRAIDRPTRVDATGDPKEPDPMLGRRSCLFLLVVGCLANGAVGAGDRPPPAQVERAMTAAVDEHLARSWAESGVEPSARSSDAEFLRRASLDLAGKIPAVAEVRSFLDNTDPEKRRKVVEEILRGPSASNHFVNTWRPLLVPGGSTGNARFQAPDLDRWLGDRFGERVGFDQLVRELLTYPLDNALATNRVVVQPGSGPSPLAFYTSREFKPEELASGTARLFLGVRIECAQCHDHPFAAWKRDRFWEFAANFAGITRQGLPNAINARVVERKGLAELLIPGTGRMAQAGFLDGSRDRPDLVGGGRESLAAWITSPGNPYFARAIVNRAWAQLFGVGIVDPVDDFADSNPPSHPDLLDDLAHRFAESGFNLPLLLRAIAASRAYQLTSAGPPERSDEPRLFARMAVKGMSGEQWYDSLAQAIGLPPEPANRNPRVVNPAAPRAAFLEKFTQGDDRATDRPTSILQALAMMHGPLIAEGTDPKRGATLGAVASAPFLDTKGRIEVLYLAALTRPPRPDEMERMVAFVEPRESTAALADLFYQAALAGPAGDEPRRRAALAEARVPKALADVFWALLNSAEFALNH
jgi:hypothetical protein